MTAICRTGRDAIAVWLILGLSATAWSGEAKQNDATTTPPVQPRSVKKLVSDGRHNAFTSLVQWKDQYWLSYRNGSAHNSSDADVIVLHSRDAEQWEQAFRLDILPDDRGGHLLATPQRLFLYTIASKGSQLTSYVLYTDDGQTWTKPQPVYEPQFILWAPLVHDNCFYANAHKKVESPRGKTERESHLIRSTDGLRWEKVSTIRAGNWESETTLWFAPDQRLYAFLRTKYSVPGSILESVPPYTAWSERPAGVHFSGHCALTFDGVTYLGSRTMGAGKKTGTMIYTFAEGRLTSYCALPSGGDCAYPGVVRVGDEMLISYYSSHEGATNIYLARVPLKKPG